MTLWGSNSNSGKLRNSSFPILVFHAYICSTLLRCTTTAVVKICPHTPVEDQTKSYKTKCSFILSKPALRFLTIIEFKHPRDLHGSNILHITNSFTSNNEIRQAECVIYFENFSHSKSKPSRSYIQTLFQRAVKRDGMN